MKPSVLAKTAAVLCLLTGLLSAPLHADEIDVVLIGGQSNAAGRGLLRNLPVGFRPDANVMIYHSERTAKSRPGTQANTWGPLRAASDRAGLFGPELSLGTRLARRFPNRKWALIKHARGGTNLYRQWKAAPGKDRGPEFDIFMKTATAGLAELRKQGHTPHLRAMVWHQGCSDTSKQAPVSAAENYGKNLTALIDTVRKELDAPDMAFVIGQILPMKSPGCVRRDTVRAQQKALGSKEKRIFWVPTDGLQMRRNDYHTQDPRDTLHLGTYGQLTLGERFADAIPAPKD